MLNLDGQVALVTGAAGGIGNAVIRLLQQRGATVAALDLNPVDESLLLGSGVQRPVRSWICDVTKVEEVDRVCDEVRASLGAISILVNLAGGSGTRAAQTLGDTTDEIWEHVMSLNVTSVLRFCRAIVPSMSSAGYGRIINVSSTLRHGIYGAVGTLGARLPYITSKSALVGMTSQLAKDLGPFGITVNAVAPGLTLPGEDGAITKRFRALPQEAQDKLTGHIPAGRPADGNDIANAIAFLASPEAKYVSGQVLDISGGA